MLPVDLSADERTYTDVQGKRLAGGAFLPSRNELIALLQGGSLGF